VGKSTISVNVAAELARQGKRVALLDFDGQCNVTSMLIPPAPYEAEDDDNAEANYPAPNGDAWEPSTFHVSHM